MPQPLRVLLFQELAGSDQVWLGVCLEHDIMSQAEPGADLEGAKASFVRVLDAEEAIALEVHGGGLDHIQSKTPQEFRDAYETARPCGEDVERGIVYRVGELPSYEERKKARKTV